MLLAVVVLAAGHSAIAGASTSATKAEATKKSASKAAPDTARRKGGAKSSLSTKARGKASAKVKARNGSTAPEAKAAPIPVARGKVAILAFDGDGAAPLRARVVRLFRSKGLKVTTNLRPVDSAEQYREMADTLGLAAFLDGEASEDGDQASVTVHVRSGVTGLRVASTTLSGERRKLATEVDKTLWTQVGPPLARVCAEAAKPRKREREPMRIEAGTPLE